jgi:hypothetical protein
VTCRIASPGYLSGAFYFMQCPLERRRTGRGKGKTQLRREDENTRRNKPTGNPNAADKPTLNKN